MKSKTNKLFLILFTCFAICSALITANVINFITDTQIDSLEMLKCENSDLNAIHLLESHQHVWEYVASGNTITAKCMGGGECEYKLNGVTLTLTS